MAKRNDDQYMASVTMRKTSDHNEHTAAVTNPGRSATKKEHGIAKKNREKMAQTESDRLLAEQAVGAIGSISSTIMESNKDGLDVATELAEATEGDIARKNVVVFNAHVLGTQQQLLDRILNASGQAIITNATTDLEPDEEPVVEEKKPKQDPRPLLARIINIPQ
jgi:hypothetical protein